MRFRFLDLAAASVLAVAWCATTNAQAPSPAAQPGRHPAPSGIVVAAPTVHVDRDGSSRQ
jgi:hypothetical protein